MLIATRSHDRAGRVLTVALRRWPSEAATLRPGLRLPQCLWQPRRPLPAWLWPYLLVELPIPTTALPVMRPPFREGLAPVPSCLAVQGVLAALQSAQPCLSGWAPGEAGEPTFTMHKRGGAITTAVRPVPALDAAEVEGADPWRIARELCDLDGDVLLIALVHALQAAEPDGTTWLTADAVLDERGLRPKMGRLGRRRYRAGHRCANRARVAGSMARLDTLWVRLREVELIAPRDRGAPVRERRTLGGKLLLITDRLMQDGLPVAWRYKLGPCLAPFLTAPNRQTALLSQRALRYDPYHERWEKRLARYFTFHLRMDAARARPLRRRIGPLPEELCLPLDRRHPERTRQRLEAALDRLARDGVIASWNYTSGALHNLSSLPARQWLDRWREATVEVTAPVPVATAYAPLAAHAPLARA